MGTLDIIFLVVLGFGAYRGYKKGLLLELIGFLALVIAIVGAFKLLHVGIAFLENHFNGFSHILPFIAFILLFVGIIILINILGRAIKKILDLTLLGSVDNLFGAILGILKWSFGVSLFLWLITKAGFGLPEHLTENTFLYPIIEPIGPQVIDFVASIVPYSEELIDSIKEMIQPNSAS
ncbi:CvpA family protein [Fulvivirgaceae bacterium BMA10]|uniref:CvpA family protein n=1 Tax=Splendidivirga corallicola TaxID=3051826 RepID=A0ABT8KMV7_9BACT|nr:CvpA family protein [Fulvivirgaceae bacterium BMA10]